MARSKRGQDGRNKRGTQERRGSYSTSNRSRGSSDNKSDISQETAVEPDADVKTTGKTANDPAWYSRDPGLLFSAANIPFSEPMGSDFGLTKLKGNDDVKLQPESSLSAHSLPGVCALTVKPSIGYNVDRNSPINVAAQAFYTHVRYVNSGRKNYDQADLMIYALAISDIYSYIMYMQRIYALAFMYSQRNYFVGKNLLQAMDVDPDTVVGNLANFRYRLNAFINKVSTFAVPADIALFNRRAFMYAGLYTESQESFIKDQLYLFKPDGFYKYRLDQGSKGMLEYRTMESYAVNTPRDANKLFEIGEDLLSNIYGDEDFGLMAGDIIKAYGSNIIGLMEVPEDFNVIPMYDEYVLSQFRNAKVVGHLGNRNMDELSSPGTPWDWNAPHNTVTVNPIGSILQNTKGDIVSADAIVTYSGDRKKAGNVFDIVPSLLDVRKASPTPEDVIEASRLQVNIRGYDDVEYDDSKYRRFFLDCGTEIITQCQVYYIDYYSGQRNLSYKEYTFISTPDIDLGILRSLEHTPTVFVAYNAYSPSGALDQMRYVGNLYNATRVDKEQLKRMHEVALLSLLYVPGIAKINAL
jgi:hypothetical protein